MTVSIGGITLRAWGLYYYGVFCVIFVLIAISQLVESTKPSYALTMVFALTVVAATTLIFPATNQAYKAFHYYRLSPHPEDDLAAVFQNTINRFSIPTPNANVLHEKTLALWRARAPQAVQDVPVELTYVVYELGLARSYTDCEFRTTRFDLVWTIQNDAEIICHD